MSNKYFGLYCGSSWRIVTKTPFSGLKQALATVNDYNPLMKDFPLNDLLSATELDRIRVAVQAIFNHLRKIRSTKYPIQRALRLLEAVSRDLSTQMLKVLSTRRLMHIPFEEFEKVHNLFCLPCLFSAAHEFVFKINHRESYHSITDLTICCIA